MWKKRNQIWTAHTQCIDAWRTNQINPIICPKKYTWTLWNSTASRSIGIILDSRQWLHTTTSRSNINSSYLNNKATWEKFDVLLCATFGPPLDVQISLLSARLQWTEKGRPMDVQYGIWTDGPNKDVLWTSLGRVMSIELLPNFLANDKKPFPLTYFLNLGSVECLIFIHCLQPVSFRHVTTTQ